MGGEQPKVFLSAVTSELGDARDRLSKVFEAHGAEVVVQKKDYPNVLSDGPEIQRQIETADLVICLIGHRYGAPLPDQNSPPEARPGASWTQWECDLARARARECRLFLFNGPKVDGSQAPDLAERQATFRSRIEKEESEKFGGRFFRYFESTQQIEDYITKYLESMDGALATFQDATWNLIKTAYRKAKVDAWKESFPDVYAGADVTTPEKKSYLMRDEANLKPPFIASQGFSVLVPGQHGEQARFLKPAAFLPGRESEAVAAARADSEWRRVSRADIIGVLQRPNDTGLMLDKVALPQPRRLFFISGGGVGKSTNMRWLEARLNGLDVAGEPGGPADGGQVFAVCVRAAKLVEQDDPNVLAALIDKIAVDTQKDADVWSKSAIGKGLLDEASNGHLIILVDELDHVPAETIQLLTSVQSRLPGRYWSLCGVVAAGRPQAIQGWEDAPAHPDRTVALGGWRFLEPDEFGADEAEVYLGMSEGESRYQLVHDKLAKLIQVPRVLEYVRTLPKGQLVDVRTSADIYERATRELIKRTLREGPPQARTIGPQWEQDRERIDPPSDQINYVMKVLSALAFIAHCPTYDPKRRVPRTTLLLEINDYVKDVLWERIEPDRGKDDPGHRSKDCARDLHALAAFAAIIGNGLLDATNTDTDTLRSVVWSNRTIHQFLAAYWLANHARGFEALSARLAGQPVQDRAYASSRDSDRFQHYLFYPEADYLKGRYEPTDFTYEFDQFLAEMPATALQAESWVAAASAWFNPDLNTELGLKSPRTWAAEMLYRSWPTMLGIAGQPVDDWWDTPYETLIAHEPGPDRAQASLHPVRHNANYGHISETAADVVTRFQSDFQSILDGARGAELQAVAREMIAEENWVRVEGGTLQMGTPVCKQGFPCKVKAYWTKELDDVQTGKVSAKEAAERSTPVEWTTGAQGKRLRERDIKWLTEQFLPLEPKPCTPPLSAPDRQAGDYQRALEAFETNWSRKDETPAEEVQDVATFTMHQFPILYRWFWLFSPGHQDAVKAYLGKTPHPPDNHPAIYISWYDAWAFCQWANWTVEDPSAPDGRRRFGLRLPHEPEWEYAARWNKDENQHPKAILYGQRYWWGDRFYEHEDSPVEECLSVRDVALARGEPGRTRPPLEAAPNGLGFRDILGNVWEWTANPYHISKEEVTAAVNGMRYSRKSPTVRPPVNCTRAMRGGLWYYLNVLATCTARFRLYSDDRDYKMGFRVVREERPLA